MSKVIRKGDSLREYSGKVSGGHYQCFGQGFACKGDSVRCNKHGMTTITEGSALTTGDGQTVAYEQQQRISCYLTCHPLSVKSASSVLRNWRKALCRGKRKHG